MLAAAAEMIHESGLTVSLEHISIEDVIRRAEVSRTAAYRRWRYKDEFFADLLRELARDPHPAAVGTQARYAELGEFISGHLHWVETVDGRARLHAHAMRLSGAVDLLLLASSHRWRSYVALQAAVLSLDDSDFRTELQDRLAASERQIHERLAANYAAIAALAGLRLRPDAGVDFLDVAIMCSAVMNGVALKAQSDPALITQTVGSPVDDSAEPWSIPAAACIAIQGFYLEPDPDITWEERRIARVKDVLRHASDVTTTGNQSQLLTSDGIQRLLRI
jgi:AcrR family transcriptional regulator